MPYEKETIIYNGHEYTISTKFADDMAYAGMHIKGYVGEPRFPMPAHSYITLIAPHTVEIVTGMVRQYEGKEIYYDCECVFFATNFPSRTKV